MSPIRDRHAVACLLLLAALASGCRHKAAQEQAASGSTPSESASLKTSSAQALRTCADRWNQGNMLHWGPSLARVSFRRLNARERSDAGVRNSTRPRCLVALAVHFAKDPRRDCSGEEAMPGFTEFCVSRGGTFTCVMDRWGAYFCPHSADEELPLRDENATADERGALKLRISLDGTQATPPLAWQRRYPHIDGFIDPWTPSGKLRQGLRFTASRHGACHVGSEKVFPSGSAIRCHSPTFDVFDPCFAPRQQWRRGDVAACANWPGEPTFARWMISQRE